MVERMKPNSEELTAFLGVKIREARQYVGITQDAFAKNVGVTPEQMRSIEDGFERPAPELLVTMARALDKSLESFFEGWEEWKKKRKLLAKASNDHL